RARNVTGVQTCALPIFSAGNILTGEDIERMAEDAIVFALANPTPEVDPLAAAQHAAVVATGRSDYPNQINNVLAFPGLFRGLLEDRKSVVSDDVMRASAVAIASVVDSSKRNPSYIVPSVFDTGVSKAVAAAVAEVVRAEREANGEPQPLTGSLPLGAGDA